MSQIKGSKERRQIRSKMVYFAEFSILDYLIRAELILNWKNKSSKIMLCS
jgi:hypothetical protein